MCQPFLWIKIMTKAKYPTLTKIVKLEFPIEVNGLEIKEIKLRRPAVREILLLEKHQGDDLDKDVYMMSMLSEIEETKLHKIDASDFIALQGAYQGFFQKPSQSENSNEE